MPVIIAGFNNPLTATGGLGTVMKTTAEAFSCLHVVCHSSCSSDPYYDQKSQAKVHPVTIDDQFVEDYQRQFCKAFLWPRLHEDEHCISPRDEFSVLSDKNRYALEQFSRKFAEHIFDVTLELKERPVIWLNDYAMISVASQLAALTKGTVPIGLSVRCSFGLSKAPDFGPEANRIIAEGVLAADFISMHRRRDVYHLLDFLAAHSNGIKIDWENRCVLNGVHTTTVDVVRMGSAPEHWREAGRSRTAGRIVGEVQSRFHGLPIILSVSRLEPHKGIEVELEVIERFLQYFPARRKEFHFIRITPVFPEYSKMPEYSALLSRIQSRVADLNSQYREGNWEPITLLSGDSMPHDELAGYYRSADILMVLSCADGFNHVSFEAVLAKQRKDPLLGLLLSDTGSSDYLDGAFVRAEARSPVDTALKLEYMLSDSTAHRRLRCRRLSKAASSRTTLDWTFDVLGGIALNNHELSGRLSTSSSYQGS